MESTQDSKSSERKLFRLALKAFRPVLNQMRARAPKVSDRKLRDIGLRAWTNVTPLPRGRPRDENILQAFHMRQDGKDWPEVLRQTVGPKPAKGDKDFTYRCAVREIKRGVSRFEREMKRKQKSPMISSSSNPQDLSLRNS
jgi:hypothetical protein